MSSPSASGLAKQQITEINVVDRNGNLDAVPPLEQRGTTSTTQKTTIESFQVGDIMIQLFNSADYQAIDNMFNGGVSVNVQNADGIALIHMAVLAQNLVYLQYLLFKGANVNLQTVTESTPLHLAASVGRVDIARLLIAAGAQLNMVDEEGEAPAHFAIRESKSELLSMLLSAGANPNVCNEDGESLLHLAASLGEEQCCRLLVAAGANLLSKDASGVTPIAEAKNNGHVPVVQFLRSCASHEQELSANSYPFSNYSDIKYGPATSSSPVSFSNYYF